MIAHPPAVILIGFAFLVVASSLGFEAMPRRPVQYPFAFGAFALFLVVGPAAIEVVAAATVVGALWRALWRAAPAAPLVVGAAVSLGLFAGGALAHLLHAGYPLAMGRPQTLAVYLVVQGGAYTVFVMAKELGGHLLARRSGARPPPWRDALALYLAGFVLGAPIQLAAHALYLEDHVLPWTLALGWALLVNRVLGQQFERMRRQNELLERLRRKERMAAIGEMSARVLHHTRHQMGLVGMIAHQIARQLDALPAEAAQPIRQELTKLAAVREDLQQGLTMDLGEPPPASPAAPAPAPSYEALVRAQSALLQPLATERSIEIAVEVAGEPAGATGPSNPVKLAQAFLNVLENAISAARARVTVRLERQAAEVLIAISDDGPGMEPSLLERATDPFVTTKPGSSGMGLAITRAVVEEEEGVLELANRSEGGLMVRLRLPALNTRSRSGRTTLPGGSGRARRALAGSGSRDS